MLPQLPASTLPHPGTGGISSIRWCRRQSAPGRAHVYSSSDPSMIDHASHQPHLSRLSAQTPSYLPTLPLAPPSQIIDEEKCTRFANCSSLIAEGAVCNIWWIGRAMDWRKGAGSLPDKLAGNMGGKLSKKKKGYNVNDEKAKEKDAKTEGASAEENDASKDNKEDAPTATETTETANDMAAATKEATPVADSSATTPKEEEKGAAPAAKEEKSAVSTTSTSNAKSADSAKAEPAKSPEAPPTKAEEKPASAPAPANEKEPAKDTTPALKESAPAKDPASATESKADAEAKKTEAPPAKGPASAQPVTTETSPAPSKEQTVAVQD
ncbi:hypothetical protein QTP70_009820 [Hemibagrus guttatus]|uniref:Brain acid soluble protein 1 n=1 Tax=Hemibagrus guttatus TaxID=175788 RepID=A0AAE0Q381_9TELE|nr:hypothetical protein QTP70_009820 [Hemibagrus guttatus]KAK3534189.1 hypothetical protein QTP86_003328 [Hemibagrus guttatus]